MKTQGRNNLYSPEQKQLLLDEFQSSKLSQKAFCAHHGLKPSTFKNWKIRASAKKGMPASTLIPIQVKPAEAKSSMSEIRIILPNGFQCYVSSVIEVAQVKRLMEVLLSC